VDHLAPGEPVMLDNAAESPAYVFNERELVRVAIYRAAVRAGFYTDATPSCPRRRRAHQEHLSNGLGTDLSPARS
jgi:hypothetical protein